jgi:hypothetical protein
MLARVKSTKIDFLRLGLWFENHALGCGLKRGRAAGGGAGERGGVEGGDQVKMAVSWLPCLPQRSLGPSIFLHMSCDSPSLPNETPTWKHLWCKD